MEHVATVDIRERKVYLSATSNKQPWLTIRHQGHVTYRDDTHVVAYETRFNDRIEEVVELNYNDKLPLAHLVVFTSRPNGNTTADQVSYHILSVVVAFMVAVASLTSTCRLT